MSSIRSFLAQIPLFKDAPPRALDLATEAAQLRRYDTNTIVFQEGETGEALYILESGVVKLSKVDLDGHEKTLAILRPPEFFGEMALLTQLSHSATALSLNKVSAYILFKDDFFKLMNSYATFSLSLTATLATRLKGMYDEAQILSYKDAQGRVAYVLLRLYHNGFIEFTDASLALIRLTHQDIASLAGTSRETVTRALKSLEGEGVISTRPKEVVINDPEGLEEILHGVR
ncbi:Crp/Fnr family transcriptional regulator [soil metagenome]|nr:Crp/Fnr family transcriptional regulator [Deinococcota bacterium]